MKEEICEKFQIPPEPIEIKERAREARRRNPELKLDSLAIWFYGIASYFWRFWGKELKKMNIDWPGFEKCLSAWKEDFISWSRDVVEWKKVVQDIRTHIPRMKKWLDAKRGKIKIEGVFPLRM